MRYLVNDSIQTREALKELGKDVDIVLYGNEGHIFLNIENLVDSETRRVNFLTKVLKGIEAISIHPGEKDDPIVVP